MYTNACQWFSDWCIQAERPFPLDNWELDYVREDIWDEWSELNGHIIRSQEQIKKEREILDCLLLSSMKWAQEKATKHLPENVEKFVQLIKNKPQTEQHTASWHTESGNLLTASEFGYVVGTAPAARRNVYERKFLKLKNAQQMTPTSDSSTVGLSNEKGLLPPTLWGHRFESVARTMASELFFDGNPILDGIGRIVHPTYTKLAASPDGLVESGPQAGHLVEIKCPISRTIIEDEVPYEYYCQMQIQMEVTNCPIAEYVEMKFSQSTVLPDIDEKWHGVLVVIANQQQLRYAFGPHQKGKRDKIKSWSPTLEDEETIAERYYWTLEDNHWKTVHRNAFWWQEVGLPGYLKFWDCWDEEYAKWSGAQNKFLFIED